MDEGVNVSPQEVSIDMTPPQADAHTAESFVEVPVAKTAEDEAYLTNRRNIIDRNAGMRADRENHSLDADRGLWDKMMGRNKSELSSIDMLHAEALAVEAERERRQSEMDASEIGALRKNLIENYRSVSPSIGENTAVAYQVSRERDRVSDARADAERAARVKAEQQSRKNSDDLDQLNVLRAIDVLDPS